MPVMYSVHDKSVCLERGPAASCGDRRPDLRGAAPSPLVSRRAYAPKRKRVGAIRHLSFLRCLDKQ